jgi:hypothetical protein
MATAPIPGSKPQQQRVWYRMRIKDRTLELPAEISMQERFAVRSATNIAFESFVSSGAQIGEDSFMVLWWLARRHNSEPNLSLRQAEAEWMPFTRLEDGEFEIEEVHDDGAPTDDPGKSVPASSGTGPTSPTSTDSTPGIPEGSPSPNSTVTSAV